jgi:hypothetical protein
VNAKLPDPPRRPRGDGVESPRTGPSAPVDGVLGDRRPLLPVLEAAAASGTPAGEGCAPASSPAGPNVPGGRAAEGGEARRGSGPPGSQPEALSGKAFRDALKAAQSAKAKRQRNQRARPWIGRDPLRKAVPGGRKPPPNTGEQQ